MKYKPNVDKEYLETIYDNAWGSAMNKKYSYNPSMSSILEDLLKGIEDNETEGKKAMKRCEVQLPDGNGKAQIGEGCLFICPAHRGFMLFTNPDGTGVEIHCFNNFDDIVTYMKDNKLFDITENTVAKNI